MKSNLIKFSIISLLSLPCAAEARPYVSGDVLMQFKADRVLSTNKQNVKTNNAYVYVESNLNLNFDKNWSIKTNLRSMPTNTLTTRDNNNSERFRNFLSQDRSLLSQRNDLMIEEIKLNFRNEDLEFYIGKFDPKFGTAHDKRKRIGVFTNEFAEDYNLREKIGGGITAFLENSKISLNTFFNDTTGLSESAINNRGRAARNEGIAGNTGTLSSYSISIDGDTLFGVQDLYYNFGYRSLAVSNQANRARETGYVAGFEYLYRLGYKTSIIPFFEAVKINNFTGIEGRDALYTTSALIAKYSSWTSSVSFLSRNLKKGLGVSPSIARPSGNAFQLSVGYKFANNIAVDFTRSSLREDGKNGSMIGGMVSYLYQF